MSLAVSFARRSSAGRRAAVSSSNGPFSGTTITRAVLPPRFVLIAKEALRWLWGFAPSMPASTK